MYILEWFKLCTSSYVFTTNIYVFTVCLCVYTHIHASFKMILSDFSSHWPLSPVHKVKFCS